LDPYYGLLSLGEKYEVFKRVGNRIETPEGKVYPKVLYENPEKYFTPEIMQALDECAKKEFGYGT
jgi:hypothetical protein